MEITNNDYIEIRIDCLNEIITCYDCDGELIDDFCYIYSKFIFAYQNTIDKNSEDVINGNKLSCN